MCHSPQVLKRDKLSSLCRGHDRWRALAQDAGPFAALTFRQRRLHPVGGTLKTPNVICIVLNKWYFAFTFPIDFAMVMSPQAASGLDGGCASRHKNEAQTQCLLYHPCLLGVPMVERNQYGYITPAFLGSPWWGEINLVRSGCGGNEQKMEENW